MSEFSYNAKSVALGAAAGVVGMAFGPIGAVVGAGLAVSARRQTMSLACAFDTVLDEQLRSIDAAGGRLKVMARFSKRIDRIASLESDIRDDRHVQEVRHGRDTSSQQDLPLLRHRGIALRLDFPDQPSIWLKIEFVKEGLKFLQSDEEPEIASFDLVERCPLQDVSPVVVADCLSRRQTRTYNALTWNCKHVADVIWDAVVLSNSGGFVSRGSVNDRDARVEPEAEPTML